MWQFRLIRAGKVCEAYNAAGSTALHEGHPVQHAFQDSHVISQHIQSRRMHDELVGRYWLGVPAGEERF